MDYPNPGHNAHEATSADKYVSSPSAIELKEEQIRLKREERRLAQLRYDLIIDKLSSAIHFLVAVLEVLLGFRFVFQLAQANPENIFARLIYGLSEPFAAPFSNLFNNGDGTNLFDGGLLVGMIVYGMLGMMINWLIGLLRNTN